MSTLEDTGEPSVREQLLQNLLPRNNVDLLRYACDKRFMMLFLVVNGRMPDWVFVQSGHDVAAPISRFQLLE